MSCGIYKITNIVNNKVYIGKSIQIERRWSEHKSEINNLNKQNHLYRAMRKYGIDNFQFEIIEICSDNNNILSEREKYWINFYNSYETGYNETRGGEGAFKYKPTDIYNLWDNGYSILEIVKILHCERQTVDNTLKNYPNFSKKESILRSEPNRRLQIREKAITRIGCPVYQYDLEGNYINEYTSIESAAQSLGYNKDNSIGKVLNDTTNTRKLAYGYQWSKEKVDKMPPYHSKKNIAIKNINTGKIFSSIREAAEWANIDKEGIRRVLKGLRQSAGKHPETGEKLYWETLI